MAGGDNLGQRQLAGSSWRERGSDSSILWELVAQMMINDQGLGVRGVHNWRRGTTPLIHNNDVHWIFR